SSWVHKLADDLGLRASHKGCRVQPNARPPGSKILPTASSVSLTSTCLYCTEREHELYAASRGASAPVLRPLDLRVGHVERVAEGRIAFLMTTPDHSTRLKSGPSEGCTLQREQ